MSSQVIKFNKNQFPWKITQLYDWPKASYPKLSVIVPSYNQGRYIEETLLSIINQQYPSIELIVIDGGSTDESVDIIKKYESNINYWVSEKDKGQSHAINKGLKRATGEWVVWMNSDDCYLEGALHYVFNSLPYHNFDFLHGSCASGLHISSFAPPLIQKINYKKTIYHLLLFFYAVRYIIPSQSVFIRKSILTQAGLVDEELHYVMDMEWYVRIYKATKRRFFYVNAICFFRHNPAAKTSVGKLQAHLEAKSIAHKYCNELGFWKRSKLKYLLRNNGAFVSLIFKQNPPPLMNFLIAFIKYPSIAVSNKHYWSLFKKKLLS